MLNKISKLLREKIGLTQNVLINFTFLPKFLEDLYLFCFFFYDAKGRLHNRRKSGESFGTIMTCIMHHCEPEFPAGVLIPIAIKNLNQPKLCARIRECFCSMPFKQEFIYGSHQNSPVSKNTYALNQ